MVIVSYKLFVYFDMYVGLNRIFNIFILYKRGLVGKNV